MSNGVEVATLSTVDDEESLDDSIVCVTLLSEAGVVPVVVFGVSKSVCEESSGVVCDWVESAGKVETSVTSDVSAVVEGVAWTLAVVGAESPTSSAKT